MTIRPVGGEPSIDGKRVGTSDTDERQQDAGSETLARALGVRLNALGKTVTTAESCTGGLLAAAITAIPGSSAWFETGYVTYANQTKHQLLGVEIGTLARHGAVSEAVVCEMSRGACERAGADIGVAVSGIAGPDGGSAEKPVGTVWLAWALRDGTIATACHRFAGDRHAVRSQAVAEALRGTLTALSTQPRDLP